MDIDIVFIVRLHHGLHAHRRVTFWYLVFFGALVAKPLYEVQTESS